MKTLFTLLSVFIFSTAFAQKLEYRAALTSGLFHFGGVSAEKSTSIYLSDVANENSVSNPYGSKNGLCYGLSLSGKYVTAKHFFYGIDMGFELLQSKILIDSVYGGGMVPPGTPRQAFAAEGRSFFKSFFYNVNLFAGYRIALNDVNFDLAAGFDVGYCISSREGGKATASNGTEYGISGSYKSMGFDVRSRFQLDVNYKRFGGYLGYSIGLSNYMTGTYNGPAEAYARLFRFGLTYLLGDVNESLELSSAHSVCCAEQ